MGEKFRLGVTGGIGSGKTSVCRVFNLLGVPVFSADEAARDIMDNDRTVIDKVNHIAGKDLYLSGKLDRSALAGLVFTDPQLLHKINQVVHPQVRERFNEWEKLQAADYVIFEAAILFESGTFQVLDRILTVVAPVEERIERVIKRNNLSREQILARIKNQSDDDYKVSRSHYVIDNSENKMIIPEILKIHNDILNIINKGGDGKVR
jgi:dephospho-CoA kinase